MWYMLALTSWLATAPANGQAPQRIDWPATALPIVANLRSRIYFWPGCPNYPQVSARHAVRYATPAEAERDGYRAAKNCPPPAPRGPS